MRKLPRITGVFLLAAAALAAAGFAGSGKNTKFDDTFTDTICGAQVTIHQVGHVVTTIANGVETDRYQLQATFTAANGAVVDLHEAGQQSFTLEPVPNASGGYTATTVYKGVPEQFKLPHGGVLTRDAGTITIVDTFDASMNFLDETVTAHGPHPEFDSGFTLECDLLGPIFSS